MPENNFNIEETYVLNVLDKADSMDNLLCQMSPGSGVLSSIRLSYTKDVPHGRDAGLEIQLRWLSQEGLEDQKKTCDWMQLTKHLLLLHQATVCSLFYRLIFTLF